MASDLLLAGYVAVLAAVAGGIVGGIAAVPLAAVAYASDSMGRDVERPLARRVESPEDRNGMFVSSVIALGTFWGAILMVGHAAVFVSVLTQGLPSPLIVVVPGVAALTVPLLVWRWGPSTTRPRSDAALRWDGASPGCGTRSRSAGSGWGLSSDCTPH